jgi:hypothetical protein
MTRIAAGSSILVAALLAWATACSDGTGPRKLVTPVGTLAGLVVSQPVGGSAGAGMSVRAFASVVTGGSVVYVSLVPGSVPTGVLATIRDQASGGSVTTPVVDGGFDPVALAASVGDTLVLQITRTGSAAPVKAMEVVRARRPPVVVRTSPPSGGRDVPLNAAIIIVISEPVDSATVTTASVQLLRDTTPVAGRVEFRDPAYLTAAFVPAVPLAATTTYTLVVTTGVADLEGNRLEAGLKAGFTTAAAPVRPHLEFIEEPTSTTAGATLNQGTAILVAMRDSLGNTITTATDSVTVAVGNDPNGGTLGGTRTKAARQGIAQFTDLTLDKTSDGDPTGYTLTASAAGYASATSTGFRIASALAARLRFYYQPPNALAGLPMYPVYVTAWDAFGNRTDFTGNVTVAIGANPVGGSLSGTLTSAAVGGWADFRDLRIDRVGSGYTLVATASGLSGATSTAFDVAPATNLIAFVGAFGISLVDAGGHGFASLGGVGQPVTFAWSPDGTKIVFGEGVGLCHSNTPISVMNADGSGVATLGQTGTEPAWSPDGRKIAFVTDFATNSCSGGDVYVMNADGSGVTRLTNGGGASPAWSRDGTRIAFSSTRDGSQDIYVMNADGSGVTRLTNGGGGSPAWSPDGTRIAYVGFVYVATGSYADVYVMNADGSGVTRLTNEGWCYSPTWSPDGTRIAYTMQADSGNATADIYVMNADGSGVVQLTTPLRTASGNGFGYTNNYSPAWRP